MMLESSMNIDYEHESINGKVKGRKLGVDDSISRREGDKFSTRFPSYGNKRKILMVRSGESFHRRVNELGNRRESVLIGGGGMNNGSSMGATVSRALILISIRGNPVLGQHYRFAITGETNQKLVLLPRSYNYLPVLFHRHYCFQSYCEITSRSVLI